MSKQDDRKALGDGGKNKLPDSTADDGFVMCEPFYEPYPNRLPGNYPCERDHDPRPDIPYTGKPNVAIADHRPIADMEPQYGEASMDDGYSFRIPMGDQNDPYG